MISIHINDIDLSDHIVRCDRIPITVRNRDYSPVAEGFGFSLGFNCLAVPQAGDPVTVIDDTTPIYLGFVEKVRNNYNDLIYEVTIENALYKLEKTMVSFAELGELIRDVLSVEETPCIFDNVPNSVRADSHGLYDGDSIAFFTDGSLPSELEQGRAYYVKRLDASNFQITEHLGSSTGINLTNDGSGNHYFRYVDSDPFCFRDNENTPNIKLSWLLEKIFEAADLVLDLSEVQTIVLHSQVIGGTSYDYDIRDFCIDENMFYCLNQSQAMYYEVIDDPSSEADYSLSKISCWQFLGEVCSSFGLALEVADDSPFTYKLVRENFTFSAADDTILGLSEETIMPAAEGYTVYRKLRARSHYQSSTPTELEEANKSVTGGGKEEITCLSSFKILLRDLRSGITPGTVASGFEYPFSKVIERKQNIVANSRVEKRYTLPLQNDIPMVVEHYIDPEKLTSEVTI